MPDKPRRRYLTLPDPACWSWPVFTIGGDWDTIVVWQAGRCALCGATGRRLVCDHEYATGLRRGQLCAGCNAHEGRCPDDPCACDGYHRLHPAAILGIESEYSGWGSTWGMHVRVPEPAEEQAARIARIRNRRSIL